LEESKKTKEASQMIKIVHVKETEPLKLPQEVVEVIKDIAVVLDNEYGEDRDVDSGDGGYVLVIESKDEFEKSKDIYIDMEDIIVEYAYLIKVTDGQDYTNSLIILNNDFAISLIQMNFTEQTQQHFLKTAPFDEKSEGATSIFGSSSVKMPLIIII